MVYHIPAGSHPDFPPLQILASILSTPPSGRLYQALVETKMATSAGAFARAMHDPGVFGIDAEVPKDSSLEAVRDQMLTIVENIAKDGVTEQEVSRARQQILKARRSEEHTV